LAKVLCRRRKGTWGFGWGDYEVIKGQGRRQSRDGNTSVKARKIAVQADLADVVRFT
jgi:hypothetical protein